MKIVKDHLRNLGLVLATALFSATVLTPSGVLGQAGAQQCPKPQHISLTQAAGAATPVLANFPTIPCSAGFEPNFGGTTLDRCVRHTFSFPPPSELCCQCVEGKHNTLTLRYKALQGGPAGSASSANDTFAIFSNGLAISGTSHALYSGAVTTGQIGTKTIRLKCSWLTNNQLNFLIQDDTSLISATLNVNACCVKK
jgi:hypothetical protein